VSLSSTRSGKSMGREVIPQDQSVSLPRAKLLILIFGLQTALLISFVDSTSVSTILPIIGKELDAAESITWAGTAFLVANTSFQIITSRLSDCFGRKIILLGSL
jgi:MFS family permease